MISSWNNISLDFEKWEGGRDRWFGGLGWAGLVLTQYYCVWKICSSLIGAAISSMISFSNAFVFSLGG